MDSLSYADMKKETARRFTDDLTTAQLDKLTFFLSERPENYAMMRHFEQKIKTGPAGYPDFISILEEWEKDFKKIKTSSAFKKLSKTSNFMENAYRSLKLDKILPVSAIVKYVEKAAGGVGALLKSLISDSKTEGKKDDKTKK